MQTADAISVQTPVEICGCVVERILVDHSSWLAVGPGGRQVVLKVIDSDCLFHDSLHPSVRDRLGRVRELAHPSVANLLGVERDDNVVYLMWEYIEGVAFDFYAGANRSPREVAAAARELVLAVDLLHMQGIVHGALIGSNVIVSPSNTVKITHISPLLYTDPSVDIECIWNLLDQAAEALGDRGKSLADVVIAARASKSTLRQFATALSTLVNGRDAKGSALPDIENNATPRKRSLIGAALAAMFGLIVAWGVWHAVEGGRADHGADAGHVPLHAAQER
jgi:tRNA A-37 threonylcarbamoyl transferase component Bud32